MSVKNQLVQAVIDEASGQVLSYQPAALAAASGNSVAGLVSAALGVAGDYVQARAGESSTQVGVAVGAATGPQLAQSVALAVADGLAGNYVGAVTNGVPALIGLAGIAAAVFTPEKVKGLSDAQIKSVVGGLGTEQLVGLLEQQSSAASGAGVGVSGSGSAAEQHAVTVYNTIDHSVRSVGSVAVPVSDAVKTV